ncbi:DltB-related membrane protein [Leptospira biflexa serovar Patoc strain 'Patoc 1 (Ames)']|uniref:Putative alginate O-acetyltransferase putative membrane protein n=1 Tax=Leptospira biflexa serovar Patoc (strain Patoc 1 / ATCC 23582 / Paris) TaxID=456481 RepID=B0SK79_LEPBP|nr:MBOAT family O-acyltransferase [Leptospira biflexa]ABZ92718.1 DltB-related membrane protein [Leptospira biflexa serovar Patoc strain 'Patoc 1 (Ames)']ABZ96322.1 Putative alginate O-acetyltransferase; putative membrane protein [Leptospira biflexa serovar Patoc strain 'Patoc 1 (Paris)']TGM37659.1 MBOAT family protein [Leptospira biflexa]TGM40995.1 MBOAT family protein [Leptospira biflexa]
MLFNSFVFVVFFVSLYTIYWQLNSRFQKLTILIGSLIFYGYWDLLFLCHFLLIVLLNYAFYKITNYKFNKIQITGILVFNLLNLIFFKYFYFLVNIIKDLFGYQQITEVTSFLPNIVLPLAISFYTFQILAFQIDVYRGKIQSSVSAIDFTIFIMFFPQLIAGPIMRHTDFFKQLHSKKRFLELPFNAGGYLILLGVLKKVIVADNISPLIEPFFSHPENFNFLSALLSVYGFAIQIYCDFSGYCDIARGLALLLGYDIPVNFNAPYFSTSLKEFWQRWHITLSQWLRDYLYISLGGNRFGNIRTYFNLVVTMVLGGLWHGANYTFLVWGALHGMYLIVERVLTTKKESTTFHFVKLAKGIIVFHLVCFAWLFFRIESIQDFQTIYHNLIQQSGIDIAEIPKLYRLIAIGFLLHTYEYFQRNVAIQFKYRKMFLPSLAIICGILVLTLTSNSSQFIYFQF